MTLPIGANDLRTKASAAAWLSDLFGFIAALRNGLPDVLVFVSSVLPISTLLVGSTHNTRRATVNAQLRAAVGNEIDGLLPFGDHPIASTDESWENYPTDYTADGLHPTNAAHALYAEQYLAVMGSAVDQATGSTPNALSFVDAVNAELSTQVTGNPFIVSGMGRGNTAAVIATNGTAAVNQEAFSTSPGSVANGDAITPRGTSSASDSTTVDVTVSAGSVSDIFTITTEAADPISFTGITAVSTVTASGTTHDLSFTMSEVGRPLLNVERAGTISAITIKTAADPSTIVATGTILQTQGSGGISNNLTIFDTIIPAGNYIARVVGSSLGSISPRLFPGYLKQSVSGTATGSSKGAVRGNYNANTLKMAASVTVAANGIMVLFVRAEAAINNVNVNTLNTSYVSENRYWYTASATSDGAMNNAGGQFGIIGASLT